ncbi:MAG: ABC transporter ATP-binding protein [Acidimicrobiales bacterium]
MTQSSTGDLAIDVSGLTKSYGDVAVVKGIDLAVGHGEIVAFLGPNGAGKTTTIEILEGFRERDGGTVTVLGQDPATAALSWRERVGIVLQESEPTPELTAAESISLQSGYYRDPRDPGEVLELVGLADSADTRTRKLSGGQKRRLDLGMALVGNPDLVFLDEPTTGFDPSARRESWGMIEALADLGKTVLLTTHYMDEAEQLSDRIVVIGDGVIIASGTSGELSDQVSTGARITWRPRSDDPALPPELAASVSSDGHLATLEGGDVLARLNALTGWALEQRIDLADLEVRRPTLEDAFLALTNQSSDGASS